VEPNEIRELIELISKSSFTTFELERNGFRLKLVRAEAPSEGRLRDAPARSEAAVVAAEASRGTEPAPASPEPPAAEDSGLREQLSPIVGTFYSSASPGTPPFAEVGSRVAKGQVLCIIEAMKVMNEIESEFDGEVVDVLVQNGQPVEFGEVLFRLRPLG